MYSYLVQMILNSKKIGCVRQGDSQTSCHITSLAEVKYDMICKIKNRSCIKENNMQ